MSLASLDLGWGSYSYPIKRFPKQQISDSSKLKEFADNNFTFEVKGGKISEKVENNVGKGEIAHYEKFLLFPRCFRQTCTADM